LSLLHSFQRWIYDDRVYRKQLIQQQALTKAGQLYDNSVMCAPKEYKEKSFKILQMTQENKARYQNYNEIINKLTPELTPQSKLAVFKELVLAGEVREDLMPRCPACEKELEDKEVEYKKTPEQLETGTKRRVRIHTKLDGENRVAQTGGDVQAVGDSLIQVSNSKNDVSIDQDMLDTFRDNAVGHCHFDAGLNKFSTASMVLAGVKLQDNDFILDCKTSPAFCRCLLYIGTYFGHATFKNGPNQKLEFRRSKKSNEDAVTYTITVPGGQRRRRLLGQSAGDC
jgi:hypothetical protein